MIKTEIILLLIFTTGAQSYCECYQNTPTTGKTATVSNAFDANTFDSCYSSPCGFVANSGASTVGWISASITWLTINDPTANLTIYDGVDDTAPVIATFKPPISPSSVTSSFQSSTELIYIKYTQTIIKSGNTYYGTVQAGGSFPATKTAAPLIV